MNIDEIRKEFEGLNFDITFISAAALQPNCDEDTDYVAIRFDGITWHVWLNPEWTEMQCYDLPNGGYDGFYVDTAGEVFEQVMKNYLFIRNKRRQQAKTDR